MQEARAATSVNEWMLPRRKRLEKRQPDCNHVHVDSYRHMRYAPPLRVISLWTFYKYFEGRVSSYQLTTIVATATCILSAGRKLTNSNHQFKMMRLDGARQVCEYPVVVIRKRQRPWLCAII
eukprot:5577178-Pleurochrysis_carterae.AAC.1